MISFLKDLLLESGNICRSEQSCLTSDDIEFKSKKDLVTATDKRVEKFIIEKIQARFPDHGVFGEETGRSRGSSPFVWVIDPIDGTTSFCHGQPFYSVSIALQKNETLILGGVYAPALDQLFLAEKGSGAVLNDCPIRVSETSTLDTSVMATGFACLRAGVEPNNLTHFNRIVPRLRDIRRYGSAAVDLCYVACGKLDGFWEMELNPYDVAAGVLMVTEAGGTVRDFHGGPDYPQEGIVAANSSLAALLTDQLRAT